MKNLLVVMVLLTFISCRKEAICDGEIATITSVIGCGGIVVMLENGDQILDNSLRLWDVKSDNRTKYCVEWENLQSQSTSSCFVNFTAEIISIHEL